MEFLFKSRTPLLALMVAVVVLCLTSEEGLSQPLDRIAATVDSSVVTLSEVEWLIRYRRFQVPDNVSERNQFYEEVLDQLINQKLIDREISRTPFISVSEEELGRFLSSYKSQFPDVTAYQQRLGEIEITEVDFRKILRRQLVVNKFIELRFEPFFIILPNAIEEYYREELVPELEADNQPVPDIALVEETIRQILTVRGTTEELDRWVRDARSSAEIQVLLDRDPPDSPNVPDGVLPPTRFGPFISPDQ